MLCPRMVTITFRRGEFDTPSIRVPARITITGEVLEGLFWAELAGDHTRPSRTTRKGIERFTTTSGKAGLYYSQQAPSTEIQSGLAQGRVNGLNAGREEQIREQRCFRISAK